MKINGKNFFLKNKICLYDFLISNNYDVKKTAVEINKNIINPKNYKVIFLNNNDIIEIISFVGGG